MSVTQYIGARYVPLFADPIAWDITQQYEPLTIVYYQGNSYTSKQAVPANIDISNTDYWALTGNYNAQIEQYRAEVQTYDNRITANTTSNTAQDAQLAGTSSSGLKTLIDANTNSNTNQDAQLAGTVTSGLKTLIDGNATDIDALEAADTAITAQLAGTSSSGLKTMIDANTNAIDALEDSVNEKCELIFIGDSWGTQNDGVLPNKLGKRLNCKVHSYAVSGTGFIQGTANFLAQAQSAYDDATINASKVKYIIIVGGSNDFSHGYTSSAQFNSSINTITNLLLPKFKNATVHVAFNVRFKYNTDVWSKLNAQVNLWNNVVTNGTNSGDTAVIYHPSSSTWFSKAWFNDDLIHITENALKAYALYLASAIGGTRINPMRTNVTSVSLNAYTNVSGSAHLFFDEAELWCDVYLTVSSDVTGTHGIKTDANGLFPIQLFPSPSVNQVSNRLGIPCVRTDGTGACDISIHFTTSDLGDTVYISPIDPNGTIPAGHYTGHGRIRLFGNY